MSRAAQPHHGVVLAAGFVIDHFLLGEVEARRRVVERWIPGASVRELDEHRWVLLLPEPEDVHCHASPGRPLLVQEVSRGRLRLMDRGRVTSFDLADLPSVDPAGWLSTAHRQLRPLRPCPTPLPHMTAVEHLAAARVVDLREHAAVRARSRRSALVVREISEADDEHDRDGLGASERSDRARRDRLAELSQESPVAGHLSSRHGEYVQELTRSFERQDYKDALRDAIGLGGHSSYLRLRLPPPRKRTWGAPARPGDEGGPLALHVTALASVTALPESRD